MDGISSNDPRPKTQTGSVSITIYFGDNAFSKRHITNRLEPMLFPFDPYTEVVHLNYTDYSASKSNNHSEQADDELLSCPAIAVMLFAPERGPVNAVKLKADLFKAPWQLHHTVILQKKSVALRTVAQQDFYELSDDLPLWSVCPTLLDQEYLRIQLFVKNYHQMTEFYRLVTNGEIISKKPGFCFFELATLTGQKVQLSLKYCSSITPFQVRNAILSFRTKEIVAIQSKFRIHKLSDNVYSTRDPDGNMIRLVDDTYRPEKIRIKNLPVKLFSERNHSDSQDSGLFSDCEKSPKNLCGENYTSLKPYMKKSTSLKSLAKYTDESDFEDPWGGSQYNISVNPEQKYKILPIKTSIASQQTKQGIGDFKSRNQNKAKYVQKCRQCRYNESGLPVMSDGTGSGSQKYLKALTCDRTADDMSDSDKRSLSSQVSYGKTGSGAQTHQQILARDRTEEDMRDTDKRTLSGQISSGRYHILPDEGYNDTFTRNAPRSKSFDSASIRSFHKPKNRSVIQILSDKILSKEKKFQWTSLNSVAFKSNDTDRISEDIWYQNPKLFRILGPPEVSHRPVANVVIKKRGNDHNYYSDGEMVSKNSKARKRKQLMCQTKLIQDDRGIPTENQIGSLVCISS